MDNAKTGRFISALRKEKGLKQKELADKLHVTDKAVSKWETGRSAPDIAVLESLSEALGVSVVEILKGERIEENKISAVSDDILLSTIKTDEKKRRRSVLITFFAVLLAAVISGSIYLGYHFFNSMPENNETAILNKSVQFFDDSDTENAILVKSVKKGDWLFCLVQNKNEAIMVMFEKDKIFTDRIYPWGWGGCSQPNEVALYCCGQYNLTFNVFYGFGMTDTEYSYNYRGVTAVKSIDGDVFLDVMIDLDDSFTNADIIYDN
ncbi:MAG: helix-turn-helix domain-containing protein [Clostridia bacterium]|nr:helix-turn-helix domain-containing protein [Clostridia bacterium]